MGKGAVKSRGCDIWFLNQDGDDYAEYPGDRDMYDIIHDVDFLFEEAGVHPSSKEDQFIVCLDSKGQVLGGGVYGVYGGGEDEGYLNFTFSVVVSPLARRRGIAESVVREMEDHARMAEDSYELPVRMEAWVINRHMAFLLDKLGFRSTARSGEWNRHEPYYEKEL